MELTIAKQDGTEYKASDYNLKLLNFLYGTPRPKTKKSHIEGRDGFLDNGVDFHERSLKASFIFHGLDRVDLVLLRNEILQLFLSKEMFYLIDDRDPNKRWFCRVSNSFNMEQIMATVGRFEVDFIAQPYAESIGTTQDPITFDSELWGVGMNLPADKDLEYTHNTDTFEIYNASDKVIDPREDDLVITYTNDDTTSISSLTITNTTNGDEWKYTGTIASGDTITIDGIQSLKNGVSIFADTNYKLISLEKGTNNFTISGSTSHTIAFDFRFKYL